MAQGTKFTVKCLNYWFGIKYILGKLLKKHQNLPSQLLAYLFVLLLSYSGSFSVYAKTQNKNERVDDKAKAHTHKILVLGDSLSAAYKIPVADGWVQLLQNHFKENRQPISVINASVSGDTTGQGLSRIKSLLEQHNPNLLILELGGNDGLRAINPKLIKKNLTKIIQVAKDSDAEVLLLGIKILPNYGQRYTDAFHKIYPDLAEDNLVTLVPFFMDGVAGNQEYMQTDGIHPNAKAQPILLNNVLEYLDIKKLLNKKEIKEKPPAKKNYNTGIKKPRASPGKYNLGVFL